ncbi:hypothetical protein NITLEN_10323 [Nitrospira lenta]|uniref:Uncharacterized protein n=1 Tax=Nitrospira lenta TaxID=1436998 RepID=A0A330L1M9_9BACT|nr:hypothetical protein NITLEN_10323 [Nitrospira lenta]
MAIESSKVFHLLHSRAELRALGINQRGGSGLHQGVTQMPSFMCQKLLMHDRPYPNLYHHTTAIQYSIGIRHAYVPFSADRHINDPGFHGTLTILIPACQSFPSATSLAAQAMERGHFFN